MGEQSNFHTHQWPNVSLAVSPPITGITHTQDGTSFTEAWDDDIEDSQGETRPLAFTNCGPHDFEALVVELKKLLACERYDPAL